MLSDRRQRILYALIEEYVAHALPVGSQTIARQYKLGISSATIRNELSALENEGYIVQPHTSAGRIPTDAGYREFVDDFLASEMFQAENPYGDIVSQIRSSADALDSLLEKTTEELARLTDCMSVVIAPSMLSARIRQISLISLSDRQALVVVVSQDGQVMDRNVVFPVDVESERLQKIQDVFASLLTGKSLKDMPEYTDGGFDILDDPITKMLMQEVWDCLHEAAYEKPTWMGMSSLMKKPEFHDSSSLLPIMEILEDDTVLFRVIEGGSASDDGVIVRIGAENPAEQLCGASVVAANYGRGAAEGVIAVIGPKRMDYTRVINAVRAAQDILKDE